MNLFRSLVLLVLFLLASCSIPDLSDENVLTDAKEEAIELSTLSKEFMYGMMWLYVDDKNETFTGWVKETHANENIKLLGYLKKGQKQGLWISWHENGKIHNKSGWHYDYYQGVYETWYPNGKQRVSGQTFDGEMNGEWNQYYLNGKRHYHSINDLGKIVYKKVWKVDGQICPESNVENGNGSFIEYDENGTRIDKHIYQNGVRVKESVSE
jgi:antitoxin component YwqK of YwqJK toxin-antitoxin module